MRREGPRSGHGGVPSAVDGLLDAKLRFAVQLVAQRFAVDEWHHVVEEDLTPCPPCI